MNTQISFSIFFELAPGLIALDKELDAIGCPIAYRKFLAADWISRYETTDPVIGTAARRIKELDLCAETVSRTWYNNVYGHIVYQPPASRLVLLATPVPVTATWNVYSKSVILSDLTLIQYELRDTLEPMIDPSSSLFDGLKKFQALPSAPWVWLTMADYDISVASFELPRAAYHLSLWHTLQCLEKLLKAVLLTLGETNTSIRAYSHNISNIVQALDNHDVCLTPLGRQLTKDIEDLVGGPGTRYLDDSNDRMERLDLAVRALKAHHFLLKFFASDCAMLATKILSKQFVLEVPSRTHNKFLDEDFRKLIHLEHEQVCSHYAYSAPPYALPIRNNVAYPMA